MKKIKLCLPLAALLFSAACSPASGGAQSPPSAKGGSLEISFEFSRQSGSGSNQYAVWIEDKSGNCITTLFATKFTASGGYKSREASISGWVAKSGLKGMGQAEIDAFTGPTPSKSGKQAYYWDLKDKGGNEVDMNGVYTIRIEGTSRFNNKIECYLEFSPSIGISEMPFTVEYAHQSDPSFNSPALSEGSEEDSMISGPKAAYSPEGL